MEEETFRAFETLQTSAARLNVMRRIVGTLTADEISALRTVLKQRCDPLERLPLELVAHVFAHLDVFDAWRLQIVCRRWRQTLGSETVQRSVLSGWHTHKTPDDEAECPQTDVRESIGFKIRHIQAIRCGRPFAKTHFTAPMQWRHFLDPSGSPFVTLSGSYIAWLQADNEVAIRNLVNGSSHILRGEARETLAFIGLTNSRLFFVNWRAQLYSFNLQDLTQKQIFRLPSARVVSFAGNGDLVAIAFRHASAVSSECKSAYTIAVYEADRVKTRSVDILPHDESHFHEFEVVEMLVQKESSVVHLFGTILPVKTDNTELCTYLAHLRLPIPTNAASASYRYSIQVAQWGDQPRSAETANGTFPLNVRKIPGCIPSISVRPIGYQDLYHVAHWSKASARDIPRAEVATQIDVRTGSMTQTHQCSLIDAGLDRGDSKFQQAVRWKDMFFQQHCHDSITTSRMTNLPSPGAVTDADAIGTYVTYLPRDVPGWPIEGDAYVDLLVNDTFLVQVDRSSRRSGSITVYCFDEQVAALMPNVTPMSSSDSSFKRYTSPERRSG